MLALVPIVLGLVSVAKMYLDSKWAPLLSLVFGIAGAFLFPSLTLGETIVGGIVVGLSASGLYSGAKKSTELVQ